jgi:8-oxo-dGTP pyrophosphatase MutT (NUDIX family)
MELLNIRNDAPPAPAATVVLLRDGPDDVEVFLLQRHAQSFVLGGAYVFPGGKADASDSAWAERLDVSPQQLHALLGEPELDPLQAAGLFVTAIREAFEECGVLFADLPPAQAGAAWAQLRAGQHFEQLLAASSFTLSASALVPWSRWVTPTVASVGRKRFDARFFVACVPAGQDPVHDEYEVTASAWLTPRAALRRYWDREIELAPPQILSLTHLARHRSVASVLAAARARTPPCIRPEPFDVDGERVVCYPGDPWHSVREQALPGPTRLHWRNQRFEPDAGLAPLLGETAAN